MTLDITDQFPIGTAVSVVKGKQAKRGEVVGAAVIHGAAYAYAAVLVLVEGKVKQYRPSQLRRLEGSQDE